jgi:hypothetical protein
MPDIDPDLVDLASRQASDLYVSLEDFREEGTTVSLLGMLGIIQSLRATMDSLDQSAAEALRRRHVSCTDIAAALRISADEVIVRFGAVEMKSSEAESRPGSWVTSRETVVDNPLIPGAVYTRNDLRALFEISDATINNGVFRPKGRHEVWLFVTENKSADREQYIDKLVGDVLHWQGQRLGRTDPLIFEHVRNGEKLLLFYRKAKYEFDGAGFRYEGEFEYVSHSGKQPTSFILQRHPTPLLVSVESSASA